MLGDITAVDEVYIVTGYTDMRKAIDGLAAIIDENLSLDSRRSAIFLFCGRRCDRIKILKWENDGYVMLYKRLSVAQGHYRWPRKSEEALPLTWQQLEWLLSGLDIEQPKAFKFS